MRSSEIWLYKEVLHELKGKAARKQRRCTGMHVCSHIHTHTHVGSLGVEMGEERVRARSRRPVGSGLFLAQAFLSVE